MVKSKIVIVHIIIALSIPFISSTSYSVECINSRLLFDINLEADQPSDIAVGPNGDNYLVDGVNNRILVLNSQGELKFSFGKKGGGEGEFKYPLGIDISDQGKVFIADTGNHRIQIFDLNSKGTTH